MIQALEKIDTFDIAPGRILAGKYAVESLLGWGWEGEVYKVVEVRTGISRAAKLFYPIRNKKDRAVRFYATKLDRLRKCPIVIQYHHSEVIQFRKVKLTCLISEFVDGELLSDLIQRQPGKRMNAFEAFHLLHTIVVGLEQIHRAKEYHGDLHSANVLVERRGINFEVKIVDFFHWGAYSREKMREDVVSCAHLLHEAVGGRRWYAQQPPQIKAICCGLRRDLILRKFPSTTHLRNYLESFTW